ncbi:MAG: hypothetical protein ABSF98_09385 [Bryobacteraceae bacterium]|jgi:hypothetical protein
MAREQILQSLESADESLRRAIAQLVEMRFGVPQCGGALHNAAENLRFAVAGMVPETERDALKPVVQRIRAHAVRVQALLDSAAAFYCGWVSAVPAGPETYAADGRLLHNGGGGRLMLNA